MALPLKLSARPRGWWPGPASLMITWMETPAMLMPMWPVSPKYIHLLLWQLLIQQQDILFTSNNSVLPSSALNTSYVNNFSILRSMGDKLVTSLAKNLGLVNDGSSSSIATTTAGSSPTGGFWVRGTCAGKYPSAHILTSWSLTNFIGAFCKTEHDSWVVWKSGKFTNERLQPSSYVGFDLKKDNINGRVAVCTGL